MGCLVMLILAFVFRGAILGVLGWLLGAVITLLSFLLSLGLWGILIILVLCALAAMVD